MRRSTFHFDAKLFKTFLYYDVTQINARTRPNLIRRSSVGTATGYELDDRGVGVRVSVGSRIFISPYRPGRLWGPPSLSNGYGGGGLFPRG
jgi:hypothetical protein